MNKRPFLHVLVGLMARGRRRRVTIGVARGGSTPALLQHGQSGRFLRVGVAPSNTRAPVRPASALPSGRIPAVDRDSQMRQDADSSSDGEHPGFDEPPPDQRQRRRRSAQEDNRRLHEKWDACLQDNVFLNTCHHAGWSARIAALQQQLQEEFQSSALKVLPACESCSGSGTAAVTWQQQEGAARIVYVSVQGRAEVAFPAFRCSGCSASVTLDPIAFGCFPATPHRPMVYFSESLMVLTHEVSLAGPIAMTAWTSALEEVHLRFGCVADEALTAERLPQKIWRNLAVAVRQWRRMDAASHDANRFGIQAIPSALTLAAGQGSDMSERAQHSNQQAEHAAWQPQGTAGLQEAALSHVEDTVMTVAAEQEAATVTTGGPTHQCPCCWRTCVAAVADACLGLTQLTAAGRASDFLEPKLPYNPFIPDREVKRLLSVRKELDPASLERPVCADFTAAALTASEPPKRLHVQVRCHTCACIYELDVVHRFLEMCYAKNA